MKSKHVIVCGAGVIGLSCAYYLRQRGHEVTVIEREPEQRDGCSFDNAGMIVPSHFIPLAAPGMVGLGLKWMFNPKGPFRIRPSLSCELLGWGFKFMRASTAEHVARSAPILRDLTLASRTLFEELEEKTQNEFGLVKRGLLMLCQTARALEAEAHVVEHAKELGVAANLLTAAGAAELDPNVRMAIAGAVHFPLDCHLTPARFMATLLRLNQESGVRFRWATPATGWRFQGDRITHVETEAAGSIAGDEFVLAGGSWSADLLRPLRLRMPLQAGKGYSLTNPRPRQLPQLCSILCEARVAVTPMGSALRVGGTMELGAADSTISRTRVKGIIESIPRYFPDFTAEDFQDLPVWHGLRPCSPDGLPYLGRFSRYPNLTAATGHAMMGVSLAPITGKLVSELLSDERTSLDLRLTQPDRYS